MNKKAQFFLIAAVVVCLMTFSLNRTFNKPPSRETENYYTLYTGIKNACMDTVKYADDPATALPMVEEELKELCKEANVNLILDWTVEGNSVDFYLKLFTPEVVIEDPFKIVISKMNVKIEDLLQNEIIVRGETVKREDFYGYETLYRYNDKFIKPDKEGAKFRVEGSYKDIIPEIGSFSPLNLDYTPYKIIDKTLTNYDFIIVKDLSGIDYDKTEKIYSYLKEGGNVLFLGVSGRNFVNLLNEGDIKVLNMTENDFYMDNTELVTIGKGTIFSHEGARNTIVYGSSSYEHGKEVEIGTVFFSTKHGNYEEILIDILFKTFEKKEEKTADIKVDENIKITASDCKGLILEINSEKFVLGSARYSHLLPLKKGMYRIVLKSEFVVYEIITVQVY